VFEIPERDARTHPIPVQKVSVHNSVLVGNSQISGYKSLPSGMLVLFTLSMKMMLKPSSGNSRSEDMRKTSTSIVNVRRGVALGAAISAGREGVKRVAQREGSLPGSVACHVLQTRRQRRRS
jgi:hypothetical protein